MIDIQRFTFNPFQENTYLLTDESKDCMVFDPGNSTADEDREIKSYLDENGLNLIGVYNTHCHVDHVLGNDFFFREYGLRPQIHESDLKILQAVSQYGAMFGIQVRESPDPGSYIKEGDLINLGKSRLEVLHIPGHAPGHVVFLNRDQKFIIGGDILFQGSIGRTDLPYGDHETLISSIKDKLMTLDEDYRVYPGHGPSTNIGFEKKNNPFLQ
ncbi:MAG TPA: MBL fold hydrolase [Flavobacteriales bacterium]|nr:MBL fold hydrolase [Flavobacteriales bacterium]